MRSISNKLYAAGFVVAACAAAAAAPAQAQDRDDAKMEAPALYAALQSCRAIPSPEARLACFDARAAELDTAVTQSEVVIADRGQIQEAKKGLFGLSLPSLKLFGGKDDEIEEIVDSVVRYSYDASGRVLLVLANGSRWHQTEAKRVRIDAGDEITIRRGALGSYLANIDGGTAIRVKRLPD